MKLPSFTHTVNEGKKTNGEKGAVLDEEWLKERKTGELRSAGVAAGTQDARPAGVARTLEGTGIDTITRSILKKIDG